MFVNHANKQSCLQSKDRLDYMEHFPWTTNAYVKGNPTVIFIPLQT